MRRYGEQTQGVTVPGRDAGLKLTLQPAVEPVEPAPECEPAIVGLFWFSDATGQYDQDIEAAYLLTEGAAGPVLGVAGLVGESCDLPVVWTKTWTPASGEGGDPGYLEDGARLVVYPLADTVPGVLEVSAEHDGQSYGPILLTVIRYSCYCYSAPGIAWLPADTQPLAETTDGWYYDGEYGGCDECLRGIKPDGAWPVGFRPSAVTITVSVQDDYASYGGPLVFEMRTDSGIYSYVAYTMPSAFTGIGSFILAFSLVGGYTLPQDGEFTSAITGTLGDITYLGLWIGRTSSGIPKDRRFTITSIDFL